MTTAQVKLTLNRAEVPVAHLSKVTNQIILLFKEQQKMNFEWNANVLTDLSGRKNIGNNVLLCNGASGKNIKSFRMSTVPFFFIFFSNEKNLCPYLREKSLRFVIVMYTNT